MTVDEIHKLLGIPSDYGTTPLRPRFPEASCLVDVGLDVLGRRQQLTPDAARAWGQMQEAARKEGVEILLVSAFRSVEYQYEIFLRKLRAGHRIDTILTTNAAPGFQTS